MFKGPISIISFLVVLSGCHKRCLPRQFQLSCGTVNINPDKDSIQVGDTLWVYCSIPANLKYNLGNNSLDSGSYNISGATNLGTDFHLTTPTGIGMQNGAIDSFSFISIKGIIQSNPLDINASKTIYYVTDSNKYNVSFGMVAQKKGVYILVVLDVYQAMIKCDKLSVTILMNDADNHLHYLKDIYYGGGTIDPLDLTHSYCFKVY